MDIQELKKVLKNSTSVLILDNGEPAFVILDYLTYTQSVLDREREIKITHRDTPAEPVQSVQSNGNVPAPVKQGQSGEHEAAILERLNKEILALKQQTESEEQKEFNISE